MATRKSIPIAYPYEIPHRHSPVSAELVCHIYYLQWDKSLTRQATVTLYRRNDWRGFHPLTNLLWVLHVTKELRRRYKRKFSGSSRNDFEQMAWSEIGSWKQQLLECPSLAEFIEKQCDNNPLS